MAMAKKKPYIDMTKVLVGLEGKWVALSFKEGQVVICGSGDSIDEAIAKAAKKGENDPIIMRVPSQPTAYIV